MSTIHAIIMAGGSGTRFWPASRQLRPKQLLNLAGGSAMIQSTVSRLGDLVPTDQVLVVTNQRLVEPIRQQLSQLPAASIIGEPCKRDTAPCIGLAAAWVAKSDPDAIMAVMPADHVIATDAQFQSAIRHAADLVEQKPTRLVTFGIRPTYPAESFGYVECGEAMDGNGAFRVKQFKEKPKAEVARQYLEAGTFYWNSGIFVWKAKTILDLLETFEPAMFAHIAAIGEAIGTEQFETVFAREFDQIQGTSIDYAVMERAEEVAMIEAPFSWDDVGSWSSLERLHEADENGNTIIGRATTIETSGCIIRGEDDHLIATVGIRDCIVVHAGNATLVANKQDEESVRKVVQFLQQHNMNEYL